jgi:hypothetical protein
METGSYRAEGKGILMGRLALSVLAVAASSPAFAAGGDDMPLVILLPMAVVMLSGFFLASAGLGFFLQGYLRLRNAVLSLTLGVLSFFWLLTVGYGLEKVIDRGLPLLTGLILVFSLFFALGWYIGTRNLKRRATARKTA